MPNSLKKESCNENPIFRYDIWLADLPGHKDSHVQHGFRPVVVVSNDAANRFSPVISIVPLTSKLNKTALPTHVYLRSPALNRASLALCEQLTAVDKQCLVRRLGSVEPGFQRLAIKHGLAVQLGLAA